MIGGAGSVAGPLIGALVVGLLPEALARLEEYRLLFFGALLLVVLWVAPGGAVGVLQRLLRRRAAPAPVAERRGRRQRRRARRARARACRAGLGMQFGGVRAVHDLHFEAPPGQVTSLIGPNGAGKTTALNMLSGFYRPAPAASALGRAMRWAAPRRWAIARAGIARTYQTSQLFGSLSVEDNVVLGMTPRHASAPLLGAARAARPAAPRARARAAALSAATAAPWTRLPPTCRTSTGGWWRSRARSPPTPTRCCSTNPRRACRTKTSSAWPRCCAASPTPGSACCWSNTTWRW